MRNILSFVICIVFMGMLNSQSLPTDQWTYMAIDTSRELMSPPGGPEWLRSFGIDATDINRDGLLVTAFLVHHYYKFQIQRYFYKM